MNSLRLRLARAAGLCGLAGLVWLAGCASDKPKPAPLESIQPGASAQTLWTARLASVKFPLLPVVRDGKLAVAGSDGDVRLLQAADGREIWRAQAGGALSAGVGTDGRFASVVTVGNEVVTLEAGRVLWRQRVPARVVTPPFVAGERVFVMSVDRAVHAFDALDGRRLWVYQRPGDALTLAQPGVLTSHRNLLLVGQGPRLTALDPLRGTVRWEAPIATPRGTNEVERLADLVGPALRVGDQVCARAFQSAAGCVDAARGVPLWSRPGGGAQALAGDAERIVGADASDRVTAWRASTGDVLWTSERLVNRGLGGGVMLRQWAVFGDRDGLLHFLSAQSGQTQLRLSTDGSPIVGTPVLAGDVLVAITARGSVHAFRVN